MTQIFWITVSLLESDYEYEFSLAVKLLTKVSVSFLFALKQKVINYIYIQVCFQFFIKCKTLLKFIVIFLIKVFFKKEIMSDNLENEYNKLNQI